MRERRSKRKQKGLYQEKWEVSEKIEEMGRDDEVEDNHERKVEERWIYEREAEEKENQAKEEKEYNDNHLEKYDNFERKLDDEKLNFKMNGENTKEKFFR